MDKEVGKRAGAEATRDGPGWGAALAVAGAILVTQWCACTRSSLWDRDEPRYCQAAWRMVCAGDYMAPYYNGKARANKPILIYWLMSLSTLVLGRSELAFRFFAPVGSAATAALVYFLGRRLISSRAGMWGMVACASSLMMLVLGATANTDAVLLAFITLSLTPFAVSLGRGLSGRQVALTGVAFGLALLTKGPVGPAIPLLTMAATLWLLRKETPRDRGYAWKLAVAAAVGVAIFAAWAAPANLQSGGAFARKALGAGLWQRLFRAKESHGGHFLLWLPFYVPALIAGFFPWSFYLPGALSALAGGRIGGARARAFIFGWMVPTFALMTLVQTKLPHYILPMWPALALSVGGALDAAGRGELSERDLKWLRAGMWLFGPAAVAVAVGLCVGPWFFSIPGLAAGCAALGVLLAATGLAALWRALKGRFQQSAAVALGGMLVMQATVALFVLPPIERVKIGRRLAEAIRSRVADDVPVAEWKFIEPSLVFYLRRHSGVIVERLHSAADVLSWATRSGPGVLVLSRRRLTRIQKAHGPLALEEIARVRGYNYSIGKREEVLALLRRPDRGATR